MWLCTSDVDARTKLERSISFLITIHLHRDFGGSLGAISEGFQNGAPCVIPILTLITGFIIFMIVVMTNRGVGRIFSFIDIEYIAHGLIDMAI